MGAHQAHGNGAIIWITPPDIVAALGPFDLDPCFGAPRPWVTAAQHYGPEDNNGLGGLDADWHGLVWCNPPCDQAAWDWLGRSADHGNAIALIFARTEVEQFHRQVRERAAGVLFLEGRICFHHADGGGAPSVLVAYGREAADRLSLSSIKGRFIRLCDA